MASSRQIMIVKNKCCKYYEADKLNEWNRRFQDFEQVLQRKLTKKAASEIIYITGVNMLRSSLSQKDEAKLIVTLRKYLLI